MLYPKSWRNLGASHALARELVQGTQRAGVPTYRQAVPDISAELRRCRRYEHPLVVLVTSLDTGDCVDSTVEPRTADVECMLFLLLGSLLRDVTRETDIVTYAADEHVYALFLPEISSIGAVQAARRLAAAFHTRAGVLIRAGIAEFPGNGLTVDALFTQAMTAFAAAPPIPIHELEPQQEEITWLSARTAQ